MNAKVRYYECLSAMKKLTTGRPSRRVNAQALHDAVLKEIVRCAKHPTRLLGYIAEAVKRLPDTSNIKPQLSAVEKRLKEIERKIASLTAAIKEGGPMRALRIS